MTTASTSQVVQTIANQVKRVHEMGVQIALVVGGGNIFRGLAASELGFDRATGDYMGMLATVINALALQDALERIGIPARTMTAIQMPQVAEPYIRRRAVRHLEKGRVVILAAGHRQSVLHHRHDRRAARGGDRGRRDPQGDQG